MIDERLQEQASLYALGLLEPDEQAAFMVALRGSAELRELVYELQSVSAALAGSAPALEPPAAAKARLLVAIDADRPERMSRRARPQWIAWATAVALAGLAIGMFWRGAQLRTELNAQNRLVEELQMSEALDRAENKDLRLSVSQLRETNHLADVRIALLNSLLSSAPKAIAVSVWDNERQDGVFIVRNLRPLPSDKDYQLWVIDPKYSVPVDAGVFHVDADGNVRVDFRAKKPIEMANKFAVTIEKKGGSDLPTTTATVLAGS